MVRRVAREAPPRLTVELIPKSAWGANVRAIVSDEEWNAIRRSVYDSANRACEICGWTSGRGRRLECHEHWSYDYVRGSLKLVRMIALCSACHEVKHIGLAEVRGYLDRAKSHLAEVNGWTDEQVELHLASQIEVWHRRSAVSWALDLECLRTYGVASDPRSARKR